MASVRQHTYKGSRLTDGLIKQPTSLLQYNGTSYFCGLKAAMCVGPQTPKRQRGRMEGYKYWVADCFPLQPINQRRR